MNKVGNEIAFIRTTQMEADFNEEAVNWKFITLISIMCIVTMFDGIVTVATS